MASMGLLESVEASPRPHRYDTLVCLLRAKVKTSVLDLTHLGAYCSADG